MANHEKKAPDPNEMPKWVFIFPVVYLGLLVVTSIAFKTTGDLTIFKLHIPAFVIWFGTLGGVIDSLQGIFYYNKEWDSGFTSWHALAGLLGGAYGLASYLFLLGTLNAGGIPAAADKKQFLFALAAFTIGYEQSKFHSLMDELFKVIFHPTKRQKNLGDSPKP